jgi:apolipoprotein N-acyltransferase
VKAGPIVCYESVFGKYVAEYVSNGAGFLIIITNDGWWKNTNGYKQHLYFTSLRAIETRRCVARAANTGISCITDTRGRFVKETRWWQPAVLKGTVSVENRLTFYVRYGDFILITCSITSFLLLIIVFIVLPLYRKFK